MISKTDFSPTDWRSKLQKLEYLEKQLSDPPKPIQDGTRQFTQLYADIKFFLCGQATDYLGNNQALPGSFSTTTTGIYRKSTKVVGGSVGKPFTLLGGQQETQASPRHEGEPPSGLLLKPLSEPDADNRSAVQLTQGSVSLKSRHLEGFFHRDRVRLAREDLEPIMIGNETASRLGEWIGSTAPQALWLSGPYLEADVLGNPTSMLSAKILNLAAKNGIPVASYFCELRRRECLRPGNSTEEQQGVVALLYALPRQMIELLPPLFDEMDIDLSKRRFD